MKLTSEEVVKLVGESIVDESIGIIEEITVTTHAYHDDRFLKALSATTFKFNKQTYSSFEAAQEAFLQFKMKDELNIFLGRVLASTESLDEAIDCLLDNYTVTKKK